VKNVLTQIKIKNAPDGKLEDGSGLRLVKKGDSGKWVFRYSFLGKRREMGLGPWPAVSLAAARSARDQWQGEIAAGRDPISLRREIQDAEIAARDRSDPTFAELVTMVFDARKANLRGGGERGRWRSPLDRYVVPAFGKKRGSSLTQRDIVDALKPIWKTKHPTATKAMERIKIVLTSSKRMGFPCDPEIADSAKEMLGIVKHVPKPMASVPWQDVPALYQRLGNTTSGLCNRWIILTLVRMSAARAARISEIDGDVWTVPADRIKGMEGVVSDFRVPLSQPAIEMALAAQDFGQDLLFPGTQPSDPGKAVRPITDAAVEKALRSLKAGGTPHGFRSSFRTWAQDTGQPWEVSETILGHTIGDKVERAYARSDLLDRRRIVMDAWARYVTGAEANVIPLAR